MHTRCIVTCRVTCKGVSAEHNSRGSSAGEGSQPFYLLFPRIQTQRTACLRLSPTCQARHTARACASADRTGREHQMPTGHAERTFSVKWRWSLSWGLLLRLFANLRCATELKQMRATRLSAGVASEPFTSLEVSAAAVSCCGCASCCILSLSCTCSTDSQGKWRFNAWCMRRRRSLSPQMRTCTPVLAPGWAWPLARSPYTDFKSFGAKYGSKTAGIA